MRGPQPRVGGWWGQEWHWGSWGLHTHTQVFRTVLLIPGQPLPKKPRGDVLLTQSWLSLHCCSWGRVRHGDLATEQAVKPACPACPHCPGGAGRAPHPNKQEGAGQAPMPSSSWFSDEVLSQGPSELPRHSTPRVSVTHCGGLGSGRREGSGLLQTDQGPQRPHRSWLPTNM